MGFFFARAERLQLFADGVEGGGVVKAVAVAAVDEAGVFFGGVPFVPLRVVVAFTLAGNDLADGQVVFVGELEVAFVMRGYGHDGAVAVSPEDVVGHPYFQRLTVDGVDDVSSGRHTFFLHRRHVCFGDGSGLAFVDEGGKRRVIDGGSGRQRVFGGNGEVGRAKQGVGAGGEDLHVVLVGAEAGAAVCTQGKAHVHAARFANPVALHGFDALRPAVEGVQIAQQFFGVVGDAEVVHRNLALLYQRAAAPAAAVNDLFVGKHGLVHRIPVHRAVFAVYQPFFKETGKQPLLPAVVVGLAGGEFARPVDSKAERFQLVFHVVDVAVGPGGGRDLVVHRRVFRRHAEGVPAHRLQHVFAAHPLVAGDDVADGVVAHVPHVQAAGRIGEHRQAVEFFARGVSHGAERLVFFPGFLDGGFEGLRLILRLHGVS